MSLLNIESIINSDEVGSRFRLVSIASQRARELNNAPDTVSPLQVNKYSKITTNALEEIIERKITFNQIEEETTATEE